jgi:predicted Zn-dependent peptidase
MPSTITSRVPGHYASKLPTGLTVATAEMPHMTSVSVGLWVRVGSRHEPVELNGASHLIEHMLFKGTRRRSAREISQEVEGVGGYMNAFTSEEMTCVYARTCYEHFKEVLDVLMDMFLHSTFDARDIEKEREVIKEEMAMYLDEPQHRVQELLNATLWPEQPLGRPITGTNRSLDGLSKSILTSYLHKHYTSEAMLLVVAGNITHVQALKAVSRYARHFHKGPILPFIPATSSQKGPVIRLHRKRTEQTQIALGYRACSRHDSRRHAVRLLSTILGENMSSRLFQVVREDRGLAYSIYSSPSFFADTGDFVISAGLDTEKLSETLKLIMGQIRKIQDVPPGAAELRRAIDYVIGQMNLTLEGTENRMNWLGEQLLGYDRLFDIAHVKKRLSRVTAAEVSSAARDIFRPENLNLALVSPLKSHKHLFRLLR